MYLDHFHLKEKPFKLSPDPRYLWLGDSHQEAWATLHYGIADNRGFILLVGDVGTGKTTLINKLVDGLDASVHVARINDPGLTQIDFFRFLARAFDLPDDFDSKGDFLVRFIHFLHRARNRDERVALIIDEAQRLNGGLLEEIRQLSNIERQDEKLLTIILVGQNELNETMMAVENRALRQRITTLYALGALGKHEVETYIRFRLGVAGTEATLFTPAAVRAITRFSKCNPRLINVICDHALLTAYVKGRSQVDGRMVRECAREMTLPSRGRPASPKGASRRPLGVWLLWPLRNGLNLLGLVAAIGLLALAVVYVFFPSLPARFSLPAPSPTVSAPAIESTEPPSPVKPADRPIPAPPAAFSETAPQPAYPGASAGAAAPSSAAAVRPAPRPIAPIAPAPASRSSSPRPLSWPSEKTVLHFSRNSNQLSPEMYARLDSLAAVIKGRSGVRVVVKGYTDSRGGENYNRYLSKFRADLVKSYFVGQGIDSRQITTEGMGSRHPIASNDTPEGRLANRRVEVALKPPAME